jgi:hypothetical protein
MNGERITLNDLIDVVDLYGIEIAQHADNLRAAIERGHVRRPPEDVERIRARLEPLRRVARLLRLTRGFADRLPEEFLAAIENEAQIAGARAPAPPPPEGLA